ncbi:putative DNA binding domain-containing protein [bacterium]|nr:putative DNA binding domain-containing protein [bacterium]
MSRKIAREFVGFSNASGGRLFIGITDSGELSPVSLNNTELSQIQDIAGNCEPRIEVTIVTHPQGVIEVQIPEGDAKPYQCRDGFYLRMGSNTQRLKPSEIRELFRDQLAEDFEDRINRDFRIESDVDDEAIEQFQKAAQLSPPLTTSQLLGNLDLLVQKEGESSLLRNAGVLFFSKEPEKFIKESYISCVRYRGNDKFKIVDRNDISGPLPKQIDQAMVFLDSHVSTEYELVGAAQRKESRSYPLAALREAVVNAVMHRDYYYQNSHIYIQIFADRIEIENPGGLLPGLHFKNIERYSLRRNPRIADLLYRTRYVENIGTGFARIRRELEENQNPAFELATDNFFTIRFFPRLSLPSPTSLTARQQQIIRTLHEANRALTTSDFTKLLEVSSTTITRDLKELISKGLVQKLGKGKGTRYTAVSS